MASPDIVSQRPIVGDFNGRMKVISGSPWQSAEPWLGFLWTILSPLLQSAASSHSFFVINRKNALSCTVGGRTALKCLLIHLEKGKFSSACCGYYETMFYDI